MLTFESITTVVSTLVALIFVLVMAWLVLKWMGKTTQGQKSSRYIAVLDRVALAQDKCLLVVNIGGKKMALAMSAGTVTKLCDFEDEPQELMPATVQTPDFSAALAAVLAKARKEKHE